MRIPLLRSAMIIELTLLVVSLPVAAQIRSGGESYEITEPYQYPIRPGMYEWKDLNSFAAKVEATQIPEELLVRMSTEALARTCASYPMTVNIYAHNSFQQGIEAIISNSNGHQELLSRKNAGAALLGLYVPLDPGGFSENWTVVQKAAFMADLAHLELLIAQDAVISSLSSEQKIFLLRSILVKQKSKHDNVKMYGALGLEVSAFLAARLLLDEQYGHFVEAYNGDADLKVFTRNGMLTNGRNVDDIMRIAKQYVEMQPEGVE